MTIAEPGFMAVYAESRDEAASEDEGGALPPLKEGERVQLGEIRTDQHFTEPPPRYSEASLVKTLEEYGIGRPSTYASIISTLLQRNYVELDKKRFRPTDIGRIVNTFLTNHFGTYVDYDFTARLEDDLDAVSRGEKDWVPLLREFWQPFHDTLVDKESNVSRKEALQARPLGTDPVSGLPVSARMGRFGPYIAIGDPDQDEKPKFFGLKPGQRIDTITLEEALALTKLPRTLGTLQDGATVSTNIGRFGPYVRYGDKYVSLKAEDDPYTISLERAVELIEAKKQADAQRLVKAFQDGALRILNGRFGPYVTDGKKNARVPKDIDPATLLEVDCLRLLENAKPAFGRGRGKAATAEPASAKLKSAGARKGTVASTTALDAKTAPKAETKARPVKASKSKASKATKSKAGKATKPKTGNSATSAKAGKVPTKRASAGAAAGRSVPPAEPT